MEDNRTQHKNPSKMILAVWLCTVWEKDNDPDYLKLKSYNKVEENVIPLMVNCLSTFGSNLWPPVRSLRTKIKFIMLFLLEQHFHIGCTNKTKNKLYLLRFKVSKVT